MPRQGFPDHPPPGPGCRGRPHDRFFPANRHQAFWVSLTVLLIILALPITGIARLPLEKTSVQGSVTPARPTEWAQLEGNSINCTIATDGAYADYRKSQSAGLEWPRGSGKTAVFLAGLWIAGVHAPSGTLRTAMLEWRNEFQPGHLPGRFNTATNDDEAAVAASWDLRNRPYKIDRYVPAGDPSRGIDRWSDWPGELGAPFQDVNGNGVWDSGIDRPKFTGRQMVWTVCNDANNELHALMGATAPMGIELRSLYSAFNLHGPLDSAMLIRWTIINRSDADYHDIYLGLWSDPDLGEPWDDLPGCDSTLNMGFVYKGDDLDGSTYGYDSLPPALGFKILQGPIDDGGTGDTARFQERTIPGKRNLGASSFIGYAGSTFPWMNDLPKGSPECASIIYDCLRGKTGIAHQYVLRPDGSTMLFWFSGDPVTGTGDLPENFPLGGFLPNDILVMLNTGPFALARGDTQEVVAAVFLARGRDRLESVTQLKTYARFIQAMFEDDYRFLNIPEELSAGEPENEPLEFRLSQNYPNPFNPATRLEYELPEPARVTIRVYDCFGREVRTLVQAQHPFGAFSVEWDGRDAGGGRVASGLYIARFEALRGDGTMRLVSRKMILIR